MELTNYALELAALFLSSSLREINLYSSPEKKEEEKNLAVHDYWCRVQRIRDLENSQIRKIKDLLQY